LYDYTLLLIEYLHYFQGRKEVELDVDLSPPYCVYVKKEWSYNFAPLFAFMVCTGTTLHFLQKKFVVEGNKKETVNAVIA
jgi:hypothetical protein